MLCLGIDPGSQGALCLLDSIRGTHIFFDTPNSKQLHATTKALFNWLATSQKPDHIAIEDVHSMGGMSAKSNFQFGRNLGFVEALTHLFQSDVEYVQPKLWQKNCGIGFTYPVGSTANEKSKIRKRTTADRVLELYPNAEIFGPMGGLKDGRSDAIMIAHYLTLKHGETNGS